MGYLFPFPRTVRRSQDFGANPGWGPNPPGGHNGDDWAVPVGTPVRAAGDGVVVFAGQFDDTYADNFGWNLMYGGLMVVLNMDGDTAPYFEYGHNSELRVRTGDRVKRGQVIALSGNTDGGTNISTGPHCHVGCLPYNFNLNSNTYGRVNPRLFMTDYWDDEVGTIESTGNTKPIQEEDDMFSDEDRKLLVAVKEALIDGGKSMLYGASIQKLIDDIPRRTAFFPVIRDGVKVAWIQDTADGVTMLENLQDKVLPAMAEALKIDPATVRTAFEDAVKGSQLTVTIGGEDH
ncbi:M23 family metallopeptidase [Paenarthrobacter nicotinovorans]|uniref:M23 family metallopeptidase n=1 Tax=Paenarthrobacter nicotinovorans TaxID=29320 RepID=UPI003801D487